MKQRIIYLVLLVCFVSLDLFAGTNGSVSGTVKDTKNQPIARATIRVTGTQKGGFSAKDGSFEIKNIPAGKYELKISFAGYATASHWVTVSADQNSSIGTVKLRDSSSTTKVIEVTATKPINDVKTVAVTTTVNSEELNATAGRQNAQQAALTTSGVLSTGGGVSIRGSRNTDTKMLVDGQDVSDPINGGFGTAATSTGDLKYAPTAAKSATSGVSVMRGNAGSEYGNATGGTINQTVKNGRTDKYEGNLGWMSVIPSLWGSAKNGLKALSTLENTFEFGLGGPLPGLEGSTFFVAAKYYTDKYRTVNTTNYLGSGIDAKDIAGNSLGHIENNNSMVRNITGRLPIKLSQSMRLQFGGSWGLTSLNTNNWDWIYNTTPAMTYQKNQQTGLNDTLLLSTVPANLAHLNAINNLISSYYVRLNHELSETSFYEATVSINSNVSEVARRKFDLGQGSLLVNGKPVDPSKVSTSIPGASFFSGFDLVKPSDDYIVNPTGDKLILKQTGAQGDKALDNYRGVTGTVYLDNDPKRPFAVSVPSNLTGYLEDGADQSGTSNPYGLTNEFVSSGGSGIEFRSSSFMQFKGDYQNALNIGDVKHGLQGGVDVRAYTLRHYQNQLPWNGAPFYDVYDDRFGGDIYSLTPEERAIGSKPKNAMVASFYAQDQISYKGIVFTPGLRLDAFDPSTEFSLDPTLATGQKASAKFKMQLSPRLFVSYPINDGSYFSIAYGIYTQVPIFSSLYDNTSSVIRRGNAIVSNPDLQPERTNQYNVSYTTQISDNVGLEVTAYYKDIYALTGLSYVPNNRYPYSLISNGEYGNVRGTEISLRRRLSDNFNFNINYTLQYAQGTSSNVGTNYNLITGANDPYTDKKVFPLTESPLDFDRRHRLNFNGGFIFGTDEGPSIAGTKILENFTINFTALFQTGQPYTLLDLKGNQAGDYNAERYPSLWDLDLHISRLINLGDFIPSLGSTQVELYVDIINLTNRVEPIQVYTRTQDPDNDGVSLYKQQGAFPLGPWYAEADKFNTKTTEITQYDRLGRRLYNANADINKDNVVTQLEQFTMYGRFVNDAIKRSSLYQYPRQVYFGVNIRF